MISTRGRYSIRILLDLAEHGNGEFIPMKEVAARQGISLKYIERMMPVLKTGGLVDSLHGIGGGYRLTKEPSEVTLWDILILVCRKMRLYVNGRQHAGLCRYGKIIIN